MLTRVRLFALNMASLGNDPFFGNSQAVAVLRGMIERHKIPQTILLTGPEGVGKATLARRFAAELLISDSFKIEQDDLSLPENQTIIAEREKWTSDKRNESPLVFGSHPDFLTFPPDGPLRQLTIQQMRLLKERAPLKPLKGGWRVVLIDAMERANAQAANSLLKTLEEPPPHLILIMTAQNAYDLLPTIRSRSVILNLSRLEPEEMTAFLETRNERRDVDNPERRMTLADGCPGRAVSLDLESYDRQRKAMLGLLRVAAGQEAFGVWMKFSDEIAARRSEKLESYLDVLYVLLRDILHLQASGDTSPEKIRSGIRNQDITRELAGIASTVSFEWVRQMVARVDELVELARRNIQKSIALDALAVALRPR